MGRCVAHKTLSEYADGELTPRAADEVRCHLVECTKCSGALAAMQETEAVVRCHISVEVQVPDLSSRVTEELRQRGEFFLARVAAGKRRVFGERSVSMRMAASIALAAAILVVAVAGLDYASRREWARRTDPVLADAERVLVRLTLVDLKAEEEGLAKAREEARHFALSERLGRARVGAAAGLADDLAYLETTFSLLADGSPLPPDLLAALAQGEVLKRTEQLRKSL